MFLKNQIKKHSMNFSLKKNKNWHSNYRKKKNNFRQKNIFEVIILIKEKNSIQNLTKLLKILEKNKYYRTKKLKKCNIIVQMILSKITNVL